MNFLHVFVVVIGTNIKSFNSKVYINRLYLWFKIIKLSIEYDDLINSRHLVGSRTQNDDGKGLVEP